MKIKKALIIRRLQVDASMKYAQECANSCENFDIPYEFIDAIEFMKADEAYKTVGTFINNYRDWEMTHDAHCCCHASHIKCWQHIADCGEACLVLEHDALVKGKIENVGIPDMSLVTFGLRVKNPDEYHPTTPFDKLIRIKNAIGGHAYAMTPNTAKFILDDIRTDGVNRCIDPYMMMQKKFLNKNFKGRKFLSGYEKGPCSYTSCWVRGVMKK